MLAQLSTQPELSMAVLDIYHHEHEEGKVTVEIQTNLNEHFPGEKNISID